MTTRLFFKDTYLTEFVARVVESRKTETGALIRLDQTAFYPTSGGQPHDSGTLNEVSVMDVWEDEDGYIWHLLKHDLGDVMEARGKIDWHRRFDHMQQHTGQHLLSAICMVRHNSDTIGFHIGALVNTIDLDIDTLTWETVKQIEIESNELIWNNIPVTVGFIDDVKIHRYPLRKPIKLTGKIRVIEIPHVDFSACGGTHVKGTGEIGLIKIVGKEKYKQGVRLEFLCGNRALKHYQSSLSILQNISADFSIHPTDLPKTIERLRAEIVETRRKFRDVQKKYLHLEAEKIWQNTPVLGGLKKIQMYWEDRSFDEIRVIADLLRQHSKTLLLLSVLENTKVRILSTRSADLEDIDSSSMLREVLYLLGGRGGGSPEFAQGGVPVYEAQIISETLKTVLENY